MSENERKNSFLAEMKSKGVSSPKAQQWDKFTKLILLAAQNKGEIRCKLKNPLILAGAIANDAEKHERLSEQLDWAIDHRCFQEGMQYLESLSSDEWNYCNLAGWDYVHPWREGDM